MSKRPRVGFGIATSAILAIAVASQIATPLYADFSGDAWRFFKPIALPDGLSEESLVQVLPDREVFAEGAPALTDLRVIEANAQAEVPYKLLVERGEQRRSSIGLRVRDLAHVPDQFTSFVADLAREGVLHNELEIRTTSQNFQRRVTVEGSQDGDLWAMLQTGGQIFDLTIKERNFTARDTRVQYPSSTVRHIRVRVIDNGEPPLQITGATVYFAQTLGPRESEFSAPPISREEDSKERKTVMLLDLGDRGLPTNRLTMTTSHENFYRQVRVEGSNDSRTWAPQSSGEFYSYNTPRFVGSKLSVSYPESTWRFFRLTIFNEDNPPLPIDGAQAYGPERKLIFSASPGGAYRLYYGNREARAPSYELERVFPYLVTENLPEAQVGVHTSNPLFTEPSEPAIPLTERYAWLLPTVVGLASLLVGLFLANLLREVRKLLPPPGANP